MATADIQFLKRKLYNIYHMSTLAETLFFFVFWFKGSLPTIIVFCLFINNLHLEKFILFFHGIWTFSWGKENRSPSSMPNRHLQRNIFFISLKLQTWDLSHLKKEF